MDVARPTPADVFRLHGGRMYADAFRITRNRADAEDAVGDAWVAVVRHLGSFRGDSSLQTWLGRVVRNCAYTILRRRSRATAFADGFDCAGPAVRPDCEIAEESAAVRAALARLPRSGAGAVRAADFDGVPLARAAEIAGVSVPAFKSRLFRARVRLRDELSAWVVGG